MALRAVVGEAPGGRHAADRPLDGGGAGARLPVSGWRDGPCAAAADW